MRFLVGGFLLVGVDAVLLPPFDDAAYEQCQATVQEISIGNKVKFEILDDDSQFGAVLSSCSSNFYDILGHKNVWYKLNGTDAVLTATTCFPETATNTAITVYQNECMTNECNYYSGSYEGCQGLCVESVTSAEKPCVANSGSMGTELSWKSEPGRTYYVQVWQYYNPFGQIEPFSAAYLPFCGGTVALQVTESATPGNLECTQAKPLTVAGNVPTINATSNTTKVTTACSDFSTQDLKATTGRWYSFVGSGAVVGTLPCGISIHIFTGTCGSLKCTEDYTEHFDYSCAEDQLSTRWMAESGVTYFVFVDGVGILDPSFVFKVQTIPGVMPAANEQCKNAKKLDLNGVPEKTTFKNAIQGKDSIDAQIPHAPTFWYTIPRSSNIVSTLICGSSSKASLLVGDCVSSNELNEFDFPGYRRINDSCELFVFANTTKSYLLRVYQLYNKADRKLNITTWQEDRSTVPRNAICQRARALTVGTPVNGSFTDASIAPTRRPIPFELHYKVQAPSSTPFFNGSVCRLSGQGDFDVVLTDTNGYKCFSPSAMQSPSGTLVTNIQANGCRTFKWNSAETSNAPLIISIQSKRLINFSILLEEETASVPTNDMSPPPYLSSPDGFTELSVGKTVKGSTRNALSDALEDMDRTFCPQTLSVNKPGVWYVIEAPNGKDLAVCLSKPLNTTATLAVFGELIDVDVVFQGCLPDVSVYNDDCAASIQWPASKGSIYTLLVQTQGSEDFELRLYSVKPNASQTCKPYSSSDYLEGQTSAAVGVDFCLVVFITTVFCFVRTVF
jgi:hypothetical protein